MKKNSPKFENLANIEINETLSFKTESTGIAFIYHSVRRDSKTTYLFSYQYFYIISDLRIN